MWYNNIMNLEKGKKVFYPGHGAGVIKDFKEMEFGGTTKQYIEIELINSDVTLLLPYNEIEDLDIRSISATSSVEKMIKKLKIKNRVVASTKDYNKLINRIKALFDTGKIEDTIEMLEICNSIYQQKKEEQKPYPQQMRKYYRNGIHYLVSELSMAKGISYDDAEKYFFDISKFEKL